jgi:hypothetical protein
MQERFKLMEPVAPLTSAEITSAIQYLDPDRGCENAGDNVCTVLGIDLSTLGFLILLAGDLVYIWLYW